MMWSPSGKPLVAIVATPLTTIATPAFGAPTRGAPFSVKVTVPVVTVEVLVTLAVNVTEAPCAANGVGFELRVTVVGAPVAGEIVRHQPVAADVLEPTPKPLYRKRLQAP